MRKLKIAQKDENKKVGKKYQSWETIEAILKREVLKNFGEKKLNRESRCEISMFTNNSK